MYEFELFRNVSLEASVGASSITHQRKLYDWNENYDLPTSGVGLFFAANIRLYFYEYYERWYIGFQPKVNFMKDK